MENRTYLVTEAEKLTGEKAHVLRYWEDELGMEIHRNSLGHRCYTAQDIQIFLGIRELKKKGLHLKAIRELMPKLVQATAEIKAFPAEAAETAKEKPDPAIPGKADEVPEVVVDLLPEREAEQLADTVMRQEEEERQKEEEERQQEIQKLKDQLEESDHGTSLLERAADIERERVMDKDEEMRQNEEILNLRMKHSMKLKQNIGEFVDENPQIAAKLIQNWLMGKEESHGRNNRK